MRKPPASRRVLIVDDQPDTVESMAMLMRAWGHEARTALDGRSAVEAARRFRPEIVFLDLGLPDIDGWQVARELRALPGQSARTRILAVSGKYSEEFRQRSLDAGCDEHLLKPLEPRLLEDLLKLY